MAAAAVLVAAIGLWGGRPASLDAAYAQDYMSRAVEQTAVETPDPGRVYELFMRELGVPVTPVSLDNSRLSRAMICLIRGKRAAMVEYEVEGHVIAHYRVPLARPGRASAPMRITTEDGVCVIRWSDGEFEHALVADVAVHQLRTIAETQFAAR